MPDALLPAAAALERILRAFLPLDTETIPLTDALRRVLAADIHAPHALPPFAAASMDGFAVRLQDLHPIPARLRVIGEASAGKPPSQTVGPQEAIRIATGATLPPGADTVVPVEHTDHLARSENRPPFVHILRAPTQIGANIRPAGSDIASGQQIFSAGQVLRPQDVGMLALLGLGQVAVRRQPRVALLSSGDELLHPGAPLQPGKIYDANTFSLSSLLTSLGAQVLPLGIARDDPQAIRHRLQMAANQQADLIISSAGVSMGHRDYIKDVLAAEGQLDLWRINMRPGKPLTFGHYQNIPFIGLPGNPVSAFVGCLVFVRPALRKMLGLPPNARRTVQATLEESVHSDGRETYLRGVLRWQNGQAFARLTGQQSSGHLYSLVQANALLILPAGVKSLPEKAPITAWLFEEALILHS